MSAHATISRFYVYWILVWLCVWIPLRYYIIELRPRDTYQLPSTACTNTLVSDLDSFEVVREGLVVLYILVPFAACFMIWTRESIGWRVHLVTALLGLVWALVMFSSDINDLAHANVPPNDPNFRPQNLARDKKWCLYWGGQVGTELICSNTGPCAGSPVDPNSFTINRGYLIRFVFNIFIMLLIAFDIWLLIMWKQTVLKTATAATAAQQEEKPLPSLRYTIKK